MIDVAANFREVSARAIRAAERAGRNAQDFIIIGAAKGVEPARIQQALDAGLRHVGENYLQEGLAKLDAVSSAITWHFIGHLQTNKVRHVVGRFAYVHSVDRAALLLELEKRAAAAGAGVQALIEVELAGEATKTGVAPSAVPDLIESARSCEHVSLVGLMTMPPPLAPEEARPYFQQLRELRDELQARCRLTLPHLSMGMTADLEVAIEEGATMVRVGTGIFGPRNA